VKGLYRRARAGEIKEFTGISSPYEEPENPELDITTHTKEVDTCVDEILEYLVQHGVYERTPTA
jgi:adenylylsulfate kinase